METKKIFEWILRIGIFGTFLGHGIFAFGVNPKWIPLITTFGFSEESAVVLMPYIGIMDIVVAVMALIRPLRIIVIWAIIWAFMTALSRPISGEPVLEFIERTSNWAVPLALIILQGFPKKIKDLFVVKSVDL